MNKHNDIFCIINSVGSINCETKENYFFNSQFDVIFQSIIKDREINVKYLSFNSTNIFSALDNYALSKKDLDNNFKNIDMFYSFILIWFLMTTHHILKQFKRKLGVLK